MEKEDRGGLLYRILCVSSMLLYVFLLGEKKGQKPEKRKWGGRAHALWEGLGEDF